MRSIRQGLAAFAALGIGVSLVACGGDDDSTSSGSAPGTEAAETTTGGSADTAGEAASTMPPATGEPGATDTTAAGGADTADTSAAGVDSDETPVNEAAKAVECPATESGLTDTSIKVGDSVPLSGPAAAYASIPKGMDAWFQHLNDTNGGITSADGKTREIDFVYLDDQYTPNKQLENARLLVEQEKVWVLLNPIGTAANLGIRQYMNEQQVPQLFLGSGAATWGSEIEEYPWSIGYQPDYESAGAAYAAYTLAQNPDAKIGVLYANDDFGKDNLAGVKKGLGDKVDQIVSEVTYETTDATIDSQVSQVKDAGADAFIVLATPQFAIQAIKRVHDLGWEPTRIVASVSSSVGAVIVPAGADVAEGWVSDAYLLDPTDPDFADHPSIIEYQQVVTEYYPDADTDDFFYLFGMSVAQTFQRLVESLPNVCRESLMVAMKNFEWEQPPLLTEGISIKTGPGDAFPIQQVQMMQWNGEKWVRDPKIIDTSGE